MLCVNHFFAFLFDSTNFLLKGFQRFNHAGTKIYHVPPTIVKGIFLLFQTIFSNHKICLFLFIFPIFCSLPKKVFFRSLSRFLVFVLIVVIIYSFYRSAILPEELFVSHTLSWQRKSNFLIKTKIPPSGALPPGAGRRNSRIVFCLFIKSSLPPSSQSRPADCGYR